MPDVSSLERQIRAILTAPAVDLNTVSAKRVRAQLKHDNPELGDDWVRQNKEAIDQIIASVFDRVRAGETEAPPAASPAPSPSPSPPVTTVVGKRKRSVEEDADAEYARRLASQLNGHKTRAGSAGAGASKKATGKRKQKKSAEKIEESDEDDEEEVSSKPAKKPKKKKKAAVENNEDGTPKKRGGFQKEYSLSPALAEFTGVQALSRPQVVKKLWDHIKANNLQDPQDKREILCDDSMQQLFGVNRLNMFKMNKMISDHVFDKQE
ncbi:SWIB-domain-containing protein [Ceratobasidium sp. AG-I]|nr:SWIB-domain-containing protein [Ceratobasidium sp. AG-I]